MTSPESEGSIDASFDGKDYPFMQSGKPTKLTQAFEKVSATEFKSATKIGGKTFATDVYKLSPDGKMLTDESIAVATGEKSKTVYERP